jgi:translation initiation factor IF-3
MSVREALEEARARGLDLVEVAPQASPPVCRIIDWSKFRYQQQKKAREAHKKAHQIEIKHIRVRPNTDDHDVDFKLRHARRFLQQGNKVRFNVIFRGPELRHREIGERQLQYFVEGLADIAVVAQAPQMEGRQMVMVLEPRPEVLAQLRAKRSAASQAAAQAAPADAANQPQQQGTPPEALEEATA